MTIGMKLSDAVTVSSEEKIVKTQKVEPFEGGDRLALNWHFKKDGDKIIATNIVTKNEFRGTMEEFRNRIRG